MVEKPYQWTDGATLEDHSRRKHKILREYFFEYIKVRCSIPQQGKFRLAVIDGFSGAGRYSCGSSGSPIIFIEELRRASEAINLHRISQGLSTVDIECLLILNDADPAATDLLEKNCQPLIADTKDNFPRLHLTTRFMSQPFESCYQEVKSIIECGKYKNVIFNLDQCGNSYVSNDIIRDIMQSTRSAEVFYTFLIQPLITFLSRKNPNRLARLLRPLGVDEAALHRLEAHMGKNAWLGAAEKLVFEEFKSCATFASPFSIHNPNGWRYWFIHFSNRHRARQVYNDILHNNSSAQAHFGRSGLNMLAYDPRHEDGSLYLFDISGRNLAKSQLLDDIPRIITEFGDAMKVGDFYHNIYNATPAHNDDIHTAIIENPDLEVITPTGGTRKKAPAITAEDIIRRKRQWSFYPMFNGMQKAPDSLTTEAVKAENEENPEAEDS